MNTSRWDERIHRARDLAMAHPSASEVLRFYERIAGFQKGLYSDIESECGHGKEARAPGTLRDELDLFVLLPKFPKFLALVESMAPAPLAQSATRADCSRRSALARSCCRPPGGTPTSNPCRASSRRRFLDFSCNPMRNISPITRSKRHLPNCNRFVHFVGGSLRPACCGRRAMEESVHSFVACVRTNGISDVWCAPRAEKKTPKSL